MELKLRLVRLRRSEAAKLAARNPSFGILSERRDGLRLLAARVTLATRFRYRGNDIGPSFRSGLLVSDRTPRRLANHVAVDVVVLHPQHLLADVDSWIAGLGQRLLL